jgi:hypothetical protein
LGLDWVWIGFVLGLRGVFGTKNGFVLGLRGVFGTKNGFVFGFDWV